MIGEWLYRLNPNEEASAPVVQRLLNLKGDAVAAVTVGNNHFQVPTDKVLVLTNVQGSMTAGAAQTVSVITALITTEAGTNQGFIYQERPVTPRLQEDFNTGLIDILVMPGETVRVEASFSAGAAVNSVSSTIHGYLLPRGTIQLR